MNRKIIILFFFIALTILATWGFYDHNREVWFKTGLVNEQKSIIFSKINGLRLISESRGEFSYQANYLDERNKNINSSRTINKKIKKDLAKVGWRLENQRTENGYQINDFKNKDKEINDKLKLVVGYQNSQGTFFSFDYRWFPLNINN